MLPGISISPDRHGSGATRIEADLSINRGEKPDAQSIHLSGLARLPCRPWPPGRGVRGAADRHVQSEGRADPQARRRTYPHTGNILGAGGGAALEAELRDHRHGLRRHAAEPRRRHPAARGVNFYLPAGAKINSHGFADVLGIDAQEHRARRGCSQRLVASPKGNALGEVTFGTERVPEEASLQAFFAPGKGLLFYVQGSSPVSLEFVSQGTYVNSGSRRTGSS